MYILAVRHWWPGARRQLCLGRVYKLLCIGVCAWSHRDTLSHVSAHGHAYLCVWSCRVLQAGVLRSLGAVCACLLSPIPLLVHTPRALHCWQVRGHLRGAGMCVLGIT